MKSIFVFLVLFLLVLNADAECQNDGDTNSIRSDDGKKIRINVPERPQIVEYEAAKAFHLYGIGKEYYVKAKEVHDSILTKAKEECGISDSKSYGGKVLVQVSIDGGVYTVSPITSDEYSNCVAIRILVTGEKYPEHDMGYYTFAVEI